MASVTRVAAIRSHDEDPMQEMHDMSQEPHTAGGFTWSGDIALRWRDLDALGHLYYGEYLVLLDQARMAMFAAAVPGLGAEYVVARLEIDYRGQVVLDDGPLTAYVEVERVGRTSVTLRERLAAHDGRVVIEARCVAVLWDSAGGGSRAVTPTERRALAPELG
jgi:YbgC/YbaW family acyl-CoA thioester hydrolase